MVLFAVIIRFSGIILLGTKFKISHADFKIGGNDEIDFDFGPNWAGRFKIEVNVWFFEFTGDNAKWMSVYIINLKPLNCCDKACAYQERQTGQTQTVF